MKILSVHHNQLPKPHLALLAILAVVAPLSGCGGGGGGGTNVSSAAPTAASSAVSTIEDVPTSGTLIASDPDGDPLVYSIASQPTMGSAAITNVATGSFTYTPTPDKNGPDSFTFKVSDGFSDSNTADVSITIIAENDAPVAQAGDLSTEEDTSTSGTLTGSDSDDDSLTYSIVSQPTMGSAVITDAATGAYTYTPDPDQNGLDNFTFIANDGPSDSNIATVTVTVNPVNDPPVASGSCGSTLQSDPAPYSGTLSATDLDSALLSYSLPDGSTDTSLTTAKGEITLDSTTGDFTYKPLIDGDRGRDTFTYQVIDTDGGVATATETVIVGQTIMPLGDSITDGFTGAGVPAQAVRVGYRLPLYDKLIMSDYPFDFVGSLSSGWDLFDPEVEFADHEGHRGWDASEIALGRIGDGTDDISYWLGQHPTDVVLLHIGTNGPLPQGDLDVEVILDRIEDWENSAGGNPVTVILARIIDWVPHNPDVTDFNDTVESMANDRIANGDDIILVDMENGALLDYRIAVGDMGDALHPNDKGYAKIANVWFDALTNVLDKCP